LADLFLPSIYIEVSWTISPGVLVPVQDEPHGEAETNSER